MSASLSRRNTYPGTCVVCGASVPAQSGCVVPRDAVQIDVPGIGKWLTLCASAQCAATAVGQDTVAASLVRELRADGSIVMPYDAAALPLLKAIASWDPDARYWRASMLLRDRDLVLRVAEKLGLTIDASLREYEDPDYVRAAVERARGVARDYQLDGIRWLAYRGTATGGSYDKLAGALLADSMGLGKTIQALFSLHDDEALVIVCSANAKAVWPREAAKWCRGRFDKATIYDGRDSFHWPETPRELVVVNYDILPDTPKQIREERIKLWEVRNGIPPDPDGKTKAERAGKRGMLDELLALADEYSRLTQRVDATTADRFFAAHVLVRWADVSKKLYQNYRARLANAKREPLGKPPCKVLGVADEAHYVENNKALRTARWRRLASMCDRVYGLTGTPVEKHPLKLYGLLTSLRCNPFSWSTFLEQFNASKGRWGGYDFVRLPATDGSSLGPVKVEPGTTEILSRVLLRRRKEEVLKELPAKIYSETPIDLPPELIKDLDEIAARHIDILLRGELPEFGDMSGVLKALAIASIPAMLEVVEAFEAAETPLVVFSAHRAPIDALAKRKGWFTITGDTSAKQRGEIEDRFQSGEGFGVAGTRAMAEAMTLTRASNVLFVNRFLDRKSNEQAEDRCHRIGQRDCVNVMTLVPEHPLTEHVAALLGSKETFVDSVLHGEVEYVAPPSRFVDEDQDAWRARVEAKAEADRERAAADARRDRQRRERELARIASREVNPAVSEQRARLRAERLGIEPATAEALPTDVVRDALVHMLSICDGAREKDDAGFNAPDSAVARWLAPGVQAGSPYAVASMLTILRHYPRQLAGDFPGLFD